MDWHSLAPFLTATLFVLMAPGPVLAIVVHNTLRRGTTAGITTAIGVQFGRLCLLGATFLGLTISGAVLPLLFQWLPVPGALYLVWLAARALRSHVRPLPSSIAARSRKPIVDGLTAASSNSSALVFYAAFFPQFIDPHQPIAQQMVMLGAAYLCAALAFDFICVLILSRIRSATGCTRFGDLAELVSAAMYLLAAVISVVGFVKASS